MPDTVLKVVVKVGLTSTLILRNVKAYRAILVEDIYSIANNNKIDAVVIEHVKISEYEKALDVLNKLKNQGVHIVIYSEKEDECLVRLCRELALVACNNQQSLYKQLYQYLGTSVETGWNKVNVNQIPEHKKDLEEAFQEVTETIKFTEQIEHPRIENKDDLREYGYDMGIFEDNEEVNKEKTIEKYKESTTEELLRLLNSLMTEKNGLEEQISSLTTRLGELLGIIEAIEDERNMYKHMLDDLGSDGDIIEDPISASELDEVEVQLNACESRVIELEESIETKNSQIKELGNIIKALHEQIEENSNACENEAKQTNDTLINQANNYKIEIEALTNRVQLESDSRVRLIELLELSVDSKIECQNLLKVKQGELDKLYQEIESENNKVNRLILELQQIKDNYDKLNNELTELQISSGIEKQKYMEEIESLKRDLLVVNNMKDDLNKELSQSRLKINVLENTETTKTNENVLLAQKKSLEENNAILLKNVEFLTNELNTARKRLEISERAVNNVNDTNQKLKSSLMNMSKITGATNDIRIECNYTSRGMVLPVFGSGSYGITTTAVSIANKLVKSGRVLYLDMDISNPKADQWFSKVPIIKNLSDIPKEIFRTGFGALLEKGATYVINNEANIFIRVINGKDECMDYFSGVYTSIDIIKLLAINFTELLNYLGARYDYIIVDLGRLGSSPIGNALIKMFSDIAYKNIIVTLNNKYDARAMRLKIEEEKINLGNSVWLLNISDSTKLDDLTVRSTQGAKILIMPKNMNMYGSMETFARYPHTKDRLADLVDQISK